MTVDLFTKPTRKLPPVSLDDDEDEFEDDEEEEDDLDDDDDDDFDDFDDDEDDDDADDFDEDDEEMLAEVDTIVNQCLDGGNIDGVEGDPADLLGVADPLALMAEDSLADPE